MKIHCMSCPQQPVLFAALLVATALSSVDCIPLEELYPFGTAAGDNLVPRTDDGHSGEITLDRVYPFYGVNHFSLFVSIIEFAKWDWAETMHSNLFLNGAIEFGKVIKTRSMSTIY